MPTRSINRRRIFETAGADNVIMQLSRRDVQERGSECVVSSLYYFIIPTCEKLMIEWRYSRFWV